MLVGMTKTFCRLKSCLPEWEEAVLVSPDMGGAKRFHHHHVMILVSTDMGKSKRFHSLCPNPNADHNVLGTFFYMLPCFLGTSNALCVCVLTTNLCK